MSANLLQQRQFFLRNQSGDSICGDIRENNHSASKPIIIVCHSFMAFKDWGFFPYLCSEFAKAGFVSISFNFSKNGVIDSGNRITEFDRFEKNTFSQELLDLQRVINAIQTGEIETGSGDRNTIVLLGHSRGGGISIIHTANDEKIKALITLSSISTFDRWRMHQKVEWRRLGFLPLARNSTVSPLRLGIDLLNDYEANQERLNIQTSAGKIRTPWLIVHGIEDVTVPVKEAELLYASSNKTFSETLLLEHVGHLYNAASQAEDNYQTLNRIIHAAIEWLKKKL